MKKKASRKSAQKKASPKLARRSESPRPAKVGGRSAKPGATWAKLGRRKLESDETFSELGVELKKIREDQQITVSKMARDLEVAPATLIKFEDRGYPISIKVVSAMANRLGYQLKLTPLKAASKTASKTAPKKKKK